MRFTVEMTCDNEAFDIHPSGEIARILRRVAVRVESGDLDGNLYDVNGNKVGTFASAD